MRVGVLLAICAAFAVAGCARDAANNSTNAINVAAEEGVVDLNSSIEGDQLAPLPEASDDQISRNLTANAAGSPSR